MDNQPPLAHRMRPRTLQEFVGQQQVLAPGTALRSAIERDTLRSLILVGPPGTGKTTLAHIIAQTTKAEFVQINATSSGSKELRSIGEKAASAQQSLFGRTVLFVDEIHRFTTAQQDVLLPFVESGAVILVGATTQNPHFDVNAALLSRSHIVTLDPLSVDDLLAILQRAVTDHRGFAGKVKIHENALKKIAERSQGDARIALNLLELAVITRGSSLSVTDVEALLKDRRRRYDAAGEEHYNVISAFIKSIRGSDVDASLLWLFAMIDSGEDPRFVFRRMAILASEDVGMADPRALQIVVTAWQAFELIGLPEGEYFLAHACVYLAQAPKSNAVTRAMGAAKKALRETPLLEVPMHLRNAPVKGMKDQGYGKGYVYPHDVEEGVAEQQYFPIGMDRVGFYEPTERGFEEEVRQRMQRIRSLQGLTQ